jgi:hypothetical protein
MSDLWQVALVLLTIFVLLEAVATLALARAIGLLQIRLGPEPGPLQTPSGVAIGSRAPGIGGLNLNSDEPAGFQPNRGRWAIIFVTATCSVCRSIVRDVERIRRGGTYKVEMILVARGSREQYEFLSNLDRRLIAIRDPNGDVHTAYGVEEVPYAFMVVDGHVRAKGVVNSRDQLEMLLEGVTRKIADPLWVRVAEPTSGKEEASNA